MGTDHLLAASFPVRAFVTPAVCIRGGLWSGPTSREKGERRKYSPTSNNILI